MKVTLEGKRDSFDLILSDPEKNTVGEAYITSSDMADGRETTWLSMASYRTQAKAGTYTLIIEEVFTGNKAYENEFICSGPDLKIERGSPEFSYTEWGYDLEYLSVTVSNDGDLPAYVTGIKISGCIEILF